MFTFERCRRRIMVFSDPFVRDRQGKGTAGKKWTMMINKFTIITGVIAGLSKEGRTVALLRLGIRCSAKQNRGRSSVLGPKSGECAATLKIGRADE